MIAKNRKAGIAVIILLAVIIIYNVCYFAIPYDRSLSNASMWISYAFTHVFLVAMGILSAVAFYKRDLRSKVLGVPLFYIGFFTVAIQLIFDLVITAVGHYVAIEWWITLIIEAFFSGMLVVFSLTRSTYRKFIESNIEKQEAKTNFIDFLRKELKSIWQNNVIYEIKEPMFRLYEAALYTDPVSTDEVIGIEAEILNCLNELKKCISEGNAPGCEAKIAEMTKLIRERKANLR